MIKPENKQLRLQFVESLPLDDKEAIRERLRKKSQVEPTDLQVRTYIRMMKAELVRLKKAS